VTKATLEEMALIPSPATGEAGSLTPPRSFNLMFQTNVGALADASSVAFLRPETAQGIFTNFKVRLIAFVFIIIYYQTFFKDFSTFSRYGLSNCCGTQE
jgi:hypothetical protein